MTEGATTGGVEAPVGEAAITMHKPRGYQQEMLAESLRQNIIVAMDTGSGKTQIAILRIQEELGRCPPNKLVWFIAPTVALAEQQHSVISQQLPAFQTRILSGNDNVDHWSSQNIWDKILFNIRIVVSTPQVLLDAMWRGFVKLSRIALLVFDEAHRCVSSDPTNMIMQNFYHPALKAGETTELPAILGLTASPVTKSNPAGLKQIEENLNAICRTPVIHREELLKYTHQPEVCTVVYEEYLGELSELLNSLEKLLGLTLADIENDPYVISLKEKKDAKSEAELLKILGSGKTLCRTQLTRLRNRALVIHRQLGPWAADVFVTACVERFIDNISAASQTDIFADWQMEEKIYMTKIFSQLAPCPASRRWGSQPDILSHKVERLVLVLAESYNQGFRVIIFAQERSTVLMLAHILSVHPRMQGIVTGHFLGGSNFANRKSNITELSAPRDQKDAINDLRIGKKHILVTTSVLEEGIDVSACNIVICFDPPTNLRSFIQRRGRARDKKSKFIVFLDEKDNDKLAKWSIMEEEMRKIYSDNMRLLREIEERENIEECSPEFFRIPSTEAVLNYQNARQYLAHFCSTIPCDYTENQPDFVMYYDDTGLVTAKVILPSFLDPSLREAKAKHSWMTERMAKRDAAYQAYLSLYRAGLVNDNLIPFHCEKYKDDAEPTEKQAKLVQISPCFDPWVEIAHMRRSNLPLFQTRIEFSSDLLGLPPMNILLPKPLPCELTFDLFWNEETTISVHLRQGNDDFLDAEAHHAAEFSYILLSSVFQRRMTPNCSDLVTLFWPELEPSLDSPETWLSSITGTVMAEQIMDIHNLETFQKLGVARNLEEYGRRPFIIEKTLYMAAVDDDFPTVSGDGTAQEAREELYLQGTKIPKRTDFLHPVYSDAKSRLHHTAKQYVAARLCSINRLPATYSKFALFVPSITHKIEILFVAEKLSQTILAPVGFENLHLVVTAMSASSAREATDYQRFEFLGDSLLKFHTSVHLTAMNPLWHEGLLSSSKDKIVSNARLSKAALDLGLDAFILTKEFTGIKWRPSYVSDFCEPHSTTGSRRELSRKVLADVVEAIIGAAYIDGGIEKSSRCLPVFLPEVEWISLEGAIEKLYQAVPTPNDPICLSFLPQIETLLGYTFSKRILLLEALTHPCSNYNTMSYQRLEFLGDSVLDHLVVQELFKSPREKSHQDMHLMRTALVNADFLAFLCMSLYLEEDREDPVEQGKAHLSTMRATRKVYLWQFMRHSASWEITTAQQQALRRYEGLCDEIQEALAHSGEYPWALLSRLEAGKFFSDLIESILGAIFVDSHGSLDACRQFLHRLGLMSYMRRVVNGEVELLHPRNRLYHAAGSAKVNFDTRAERVEDDAEGSKVQWICRIRVGDEDIVEVRDGLNKAEIETRASAVAAAIFEARAMESVSEMGSRDTSSDQMLDHSSEMDLTTDY
ncbi:hypothetical protein VTN77DRAFT_4823 [Rasamsonia byssochlamydoides]|uniref:uncharacterized protein n=1 Tax=Rasamsonia byssochlamydoides TaxID=89139 RepID=UPI0037433F75